MTPRPPSLFVTPVTPNPAGTGIEQRAFHLLNTLSLTTEVTLLQPSTTETLPPATQLHIAKHITIPLQTPKPWQRTLALLFPPLVLLKQHWTTDWLHPALFDLPHEAAQLLVFRLRSHDLAQSIAQLFPSTTRHLDLDDIESTTLFSIARLALRRGRLRLALKTLAKALQYRLLERRLIPSYDRVTVANPDDATRLHLAYEPNRIPVPDPFPTRSHVPPFTLLFLGALGYFPNIDAALWIAQSLTPALRLALPQGFRILIAGRGADHRLRRALALVPEIQLIPNVLDTAPLFEEADVFLAPLRAGGGTRIKLLEAFAHGCPVIATPFAVAGLPFTAASHYLSAETPTAFARHCAALCADPLLAEALAHNAFAQLKISPCNASPSAATESTSTSRPPSSR